MSDTGQPFIAHRLSPRIKRWLLLTAATATLVGVAAHLSTTRADDTRQAIAPGSLPPVFVGPSAGLARGESCWITGDLVGDANPATVASTFCGPKSATQR